MDPAEVLPPAGPGLSTLTVGVAEPGLCGLAALRSTLWLARWCVRGHMMPPAARPDGGMLRLAARRVEPGLVTQEYGGAD